MPVARKIMIAVAGMAWLYSALPAALAQDAKAKKEIKLAVVDVGVKDKAPAAFMDFLTVAFGKQSSIVLLERAEVERLLREQALSLSLSNPVETEAAVKAGKLWAVDAFLMLEAAKTPKGPIRVRYRLVDAHHGMKVLDANLLLEADGKLFPEQANALAKSAAQKLAGFTKDAKGIRLIGVATVQSKELSKSWDWLSEALAAGLEQHLGLEPSVILMERKQTRTLTDERLLVEGLPDALKASAVLVTGNFKLERDKGLDAISVQIQCRAGGKVILERTVHGSLQQPGVIAQKLAKEIAAGLPGGTVATRSMSPQAEAKMLADQARAFFSLQSWTNDPEQALAPAEAALALVPTSNEYRCLLLTILNAQLGQKSYFENGRVRDDLMQEALAYCARAIPAAEQIVAKPDGSLPSMWRFEVAKVFTHYFVHHWLHVKDEQPGSLEDDDAAKGVRKGLRAIFARGMALPGGYDVDFVQAAVQLGYVWCDTPEQAFKLFIDALEASSAEFKRSPSFVMGVIQPSASFYHHFSHCPQWAKRRDLEQLYADHLETLCKHKEPAFRLTGELRAVDFYNRTPGRLDYEKARKHFQTFLRILKTEVQPKAPRDAFAYHSWVYISLANGRFAEDLKKDAEIKAGFLREVLDFFLADPGRFQQLNQWRDSLDAHSQHLETLGKQDEAYRFLQEHALRLKGVKLTGTDPGVLPELMATLARRHPSLRAAADKNNPYKAEPVVLVKDLTRFFEKKPWAGSGLIHFRRIILDDKVAAVVCTNDSGRKERYGLLRLDPATLKPVSFTEYPVDFATDTKWPIEYHVWYGPPVAVAGADVYVGSPYAGVVCFPVQGAAKHWSEKSGLASNQIRSLTILGNKLYAATGTVHTDSGLIELDLGTGKSAILFSSKAKDSSNVLDGRPINAVAADAKRQCLWLAVLPKYATNDKGILFAYYPKEQKTVKKMDAERGLDWLEPRQGKLLMVATAYALSLDMDTAEITALMYADGRGYHIPYKAPRNLPFGGFHGNRILLSVGKYLIYVDQTRGSLVAMADDDDRPSSIIEKCFPDRPDHYVIKDLAMSRQGLLLLTREGLFLSSGVKGDANPKAQ